MNTTYIPFITILDITNETTVSKNVSSDLLLPYVKVSQENFIQEELGLTQYELLLDAVNTYALTGITGSSLNLINEIKTTLIYYTYWTAFPFLWAKISNKGISTKQADQTSGESIQEEEMKSLRAEIFNWAEKSHNRLRRFLYLNKDTYTSWREYGDSTTDYPWNNSNPKKKYFSGIHFSKKRNFPDSDFYNDNDYSQ